ncbi:MAG: thiamine-binding protein [Lachnospiraceae bacterium]|nr:thiamine-binding protein [Lachnospiraceae bacterium]MCD8124434.1 thiamine-binding protein [Lachnospiraceae bacterium]
MKASVAIQVLPKTDSDQETVRIVDEVIAYIASTGLNYYVGPFETTIEGDDYEQLMEIVKNCQLIALKAGCDKVSAYVKIVCRAEGDILTIDEKVGKYHLE